MKRLLIIPARLGSKRILKKNIKLFLGKPIINYSIETAIKSKLFHTIHISTESKIVKKVVEKMNIKINFLRDKKLADDKTVLLDVYKFVVNKYKKIGLKFDEVWFLYPCSPLISFKDLIKASNFFKKKKLNSMIAISENAPPIQWSFYLKNNYKLQAIFKKSYFNFRSQDLKKTYYDTGTFGAYKPSCLFKKNFKYSGFVIPRYKGIDIDTADDWVLAEKIFKNNIEKN